MTALEFVIMCVAFTWGFLFGEGYGRNNEKKRH